MESSREESLRDMVEQDKAIASARRVLEVEARAIMDLRAQLGKGFSEAVRRIYACEGKVLVSGVGKSGYVSRKIAATLTSTGTPAIFLHPAEGAHGDLGMATRKDVFLFVSNSGETEEVLRLLPSIRRMGCAIISMTSRRGSTLARNSDVVIPVEVKEEACPLGLAPTASTTAALAVGDALAVALLEMRGFTRRDFARLHPGGTLGRRLLLTVGDLMHTGDSIPLVRQDTPMREAIVEITSKALGVTGVLDENGRLVGVITDGDLRRGLEREPDLLSQKAKAIMTSNPKWIHKDALAVDALNQMQRYSITSLFVFDSPQRGRLEGIIHLHDLLRAGVV